MPSRLSNFIVKTIVRSPFNFVLGPSVGVITVKGRKSGKPYSTPVNVLRLGEGYTVVSLRGRSWWRNLREGQAAVLRLAGKSLSVTGRVINKPEKVAGGLASYFRQYPTYAKYFRVRIEAGGEPNRADLEAAASERVLVRLSPSPAVAMAP